jgi:hypothetical protein
MGLTRTERVRSVDRPGLNGSVQVEGVDRPYQSSSDEHEPSRLELSARAPEPSQLELVFNQARAARAGFQTGSSQLELFRA